MDVKKPVSEIPKDIVEALLLVSAYGGNAPPPPSPSAQTLPNGIILAGSASSKLYPFFSDVDGIQNADFDSYAHAAVALQGAVRRIRDTPGYCFVELKAGRDDAGIIFPPRCWVEHDKVVNWDLGFTQAHLLKAARAGLLAGYGSEKDPAFADMVKQYARFDKEPPPPRTFVKWLDITPWKLRWAARSVLDGYKILKSNVAEPLFLPDALAQPALVKLDAMFWSASQQRFLDLSMIYVFTIKGKPANSFYSELSPPPQLGLQQDAYAQWLWKDYAKLAKRLMSLAVLLDRETDVAKLRHIVVSDAGRAAQVASDCTTMQEALDAYHPVPLKKVHAEVEGIKDRAASVYGLGIEEEGRLTRACRAAARASTSPGGLAALASQLEAVREELSRFFQAAFQEELRTAGYLPLPAWAMP